MKLEEIDLKFPKNCSYDYTLDDSSVKYGEYHVDTHHSLTKKCRLKNSMVEMLVLDLTKNKDN